MKEKVDTETELPDPSDFASSAIHAANESIRALLEEKNNTCHVNKCLNSFNN